MEQEKSAIRKEHEDDKNAKLKRTICFPSKFELETAMDRAGLRNISGPRGLGPGHLRRPSQRGATARRGRLRFGA